MRYSIADDLDPERDIGADADPVLAYLDLPRGMREGAVGDMGFTLQDLGQRE